MKSYFHETQLLFLFWDSLSYTNAILLYDLMLCGFPNVGKRWHLMEDLANIKCHHDSNHGLHSLSHHHVAMIEIIEIPGKTKENFPSKIYAQ